ncbi:hypothetical protein POV27_13750 [Aureisphaera galaxeae]|uniref:hypothetical protein n=1 Tax=Aureisphaera galaxeae TaxID=1538023 RepID=UPI00234FE61E|nr:hypothetical protein [Aureisphaera galaxeae]MDC8005121.1 hypothetical protein [Aureisphaera galaxeae]
MKTPKTYPYIILIALLVFFSCKEDETRTCTQCNNEQTPSFELCREPNGNASVNGEDTGTNYDVYLADLEEVGTTCGG